MKEFVCAFDCVRLEATNFEGGFCMNMNTKKGIIITVIVAIAVGGLAGVASRELFDLDGGLVGAIISSTIFILSGGLALGKSKKKDDGKE